MASCISRLSACCDTRHVFGFCKPAREANTINKKNFAAAAGVVLAGFLCVLPIPGLDRTGSAALGILAWAIVWWAGHVMPDFATALLMCALYVLVCGVPMETMFSAYAGSSFWLLLASFALSLGINRCGLMKRLALGILRLFPKSFAGQALGLLAAGAVIGPFIPNLSAKAAILAPISLSISDAMGYEHRSKPSAGLFLAMLTGIRSPGPLFISASVLGYAFVGLYPESVAARFDMVHWFLAALPWFLIVSAADFFALLLLYSPRDSKNRSTASESVSDGHGKMGSMSRDEKLMLAITLLTMAMWATESVHGIPAALVALTSMCVMMALGLLDGKSFSQGMNWGPLLFVGAATGLAPAFAYLGLDDWIVSVCRPLLGAAGDAPALFLLTVGVVVILVRFVVAAELATVNLLLIFLIPMSLEIGLNPWVSGFAVYCAICPWFFLYQNPVYMTAYAATGGQMLRESEASGYCAVYLSISLAAMALCVPIWFAAGILRI